MVDEDASAMADETAPAIETSEAWSEAHLLEVTEAHARAAIRSRVGYAIPLEKVREPGAYVAVANGRLFRLPYEALGEGGPVFRVLGPGGDETVVFLSSDPETPLTELRFASICAGVWPRF